ncbi:hypothetical protein [Streptomyces prunicolor]|uniref:hypothetical protein n=1 Tax=Streptomyces prunicolor TaxID=67348 RepID=UPI000367D6B4|nr:hypothetical protein [Streptomyces prunicolor]
MQTTRDGTPEAAQATPPTSRRTRSHLVGRVAVASAVALFAAVGTTIATAPTASAVDSKGCNSAWYYFNGHINTNGVNLRNGPGTSYVSKGLLSKGTRTYVYCYREASGANSRSWDYIKVTSGPNKNVKGWVRSGYNNWW